MCLLPVNYVSITVFPCFINIFLIAVSLFPLQASASGSQSAAAGEQVDSGMGIWRGMIRKGEESSTGDRVVPQPPPPASPQRGHAVNLLDVVGTLQQ